MSARHDYGPLQTYQVIWKSGHVEEIQGHQLLMDSNSAAFSMGQMFDVRTEARAADPKIQIYGEFDGHWRLVLLAPESEISSLRLLPQSVAAEAGEQS